MLVATFSDSSLSHFPVWEATSFRLDEAASASAKPLVLSMAHVSPGLPSMTATSAVFEPSF